MLLLIDAGNTRIKWALADPGAAPGEWLASGAAHHQEDELLASHWQGQAIQRVLMSNVAGAPALQAVQAALARCADSGSAGAPVIEAFQSCAARAGLRNAYRDPQQLGADRFASSIGARALFPGEDLLVATCGTATTVDVISADGVFKGGMILPGLRLMAQALARHTAQLPQVAERMQTGSAFADNTEEAIVLGCLSAQAGAIERARARLPGARCIISGGAARMVAPCLDGPATWVENLVLVGLQAAAMEQESAC